MSNTEREKEFAYIQSIVTDMGNGGSWCSSCHTELDIMDILNQRWFIIEKINAGNLMEPEEVYCPNPDCAKPLKQGSIWTSSGGSDF